MDGVDQKLMSWRLKMLKPKKAEVESELISLMPLASPEGIARIPVD